MAKLPPQPIGVPPGHSFWNDWYEKIRRLVDQALSAVVNFVDLNFSGSNITSISTRNHNDLQTLQGGTTNEYFHLTSAEDSALAAGLSVTITTAKITVAGTNGSMTFTNGILTAQTPAT